MCKLNVPVLKLQNINFSFRKNAAITIKEFIAITFTALKIQVFQACAT